MHFELNWVKKPESETFILCSYSTWSVSVFESKLKCGKRWYANPILYVNPTRFIPTPRARDDAVVSNNNVGDSDSKRSHGYSAAAGSTDLVLPLLGAVTTQAPMLDAKDVVLLTASGVVTCVESQGRLALRQRIVLPPGAACPRASLSQLLLRLVRHGRYRRRLCVVFWNPNKHVVFDRI